MMESLLNGFIIDKVQILSLVSLNECGSTYEARDLLTSTVCQLQIFSVKHAIASNEDVQKEIKGSKKKNTCLRTWKSGYWIFVLLKSLVEKDHAGGARRQRHDKAQGRRRRPKKKSLTRTASEQTELEELSTQTTQLGANITTPQGSESHGSRVDLEDERWISDNNPRIVKHRSHTLRNDLNNLKNEMNILEARCSSMETILDKRTEYRRRLSELEDRSRSIETEDMTLKDNMKIQHWLELPERRLESESKARTLNTCSEALKALSIVHTSELPRAPSSTKTPASLYLLASREQQGGQDIRTMQGSDIQLVETQLLNLERSPPGNIQDADDTGTTSEDREPSESAEVGAQAKEIQRQRDVTTASLYQQFPIYHPSSRDAKTGTRFLIRLLEIMPEYMGESIFCKMTIAALTSESKSDFLALSYCWGSNKADTRPILVNGYEVNITESLHTALRYLRKPLKSIKLWVDAVCINQKDIEERNYQVTQMAKVYSAAKELVSWLGERTEESDQAMKLIARGPEALSRPIRLEDTLGDIFSRSYWSRVWVVQEIAAAKRTNRITTLRCGDQTVSLQQFETFLRYLLSQKRLPKIKSALGPKSLLALSTPDPSRSFLSVLWESSSLEASESHDRIFGIRGISPKFYRENIPVKYSMSYKELLIKVLTLVINKERSLDILSSFHAYPTEPSTVSTSWLRDLSKRNPGISPTMYDCCKGHRCSATIVNNILRTKGLCIGTVDKLEIHTREPVYNNTNDRLLSSSPSSLSSADITSHLRTIELAISALEVSYPDDTAQARADRFLESVAGGKQQILEKFDLQLWRKGYARAERNPMEWHRLCGSFSRLFARLNGRAVFTTSEDGSLGIGPREMRHGDLVCVLFGSRVPMVLRKDGRFFNFIGPAYVDGAMNGKFVKNGVEGKRFWIR